MSSILSFLSDIYQFIYNMWTFWFTWLPGPLGVPLSIVTFIGMILGIIKLFAFILDCIPFF